MKANILIVDDEKNAREGLKKALSSHGYDISLAENGKEALELIQNSRYDMMLTDLRMPVMGGLELIDKVKMLDSDIIIIVLTAYGTIETAVEAMRRGARDYISKPINLDELEIVIDRSLQQREIESENIRLHEQLDKRFGFENMIGNNHAMQEIYNTIRQVAPTKASVLIQGESGTGKELIAQAIHRLSPRKNAPFIPVHCAALSEGILEAELFGHEKGAFTGAYERSVGRFERADKGTLFLDEITETSPQLQVKLLRVIQDMKIERVGGRELVQVDVRLISATNSDLNAIVADGKFREDLFYRLNVVRVIVPPLRERPEDIPLLVDYFLKMAASENNKELQTLSSDVLDIFLKYHWPGNVRELRNCIESMVVLGKNKQLAVSDIPSHMNIEKTVIPSAKVFQVGIPMRDLEKGVIIKTLQLTNNNKTKAAKMLGISRRTLHRKIHEYHLESVLE